MVKHQDMVIVEPKHNTNFNHSEAMEYYNEASRLLEKYRPVKPSEVELPFLANQTVFHVISSATMALTGVPTLIYWIISPTLFPHISHEAGVQLMCAGLTFSALSVVGAIGLGILSWNGNPKKRIRSFLSNIFLTKKAKKKIETYLKERSDYKNSVKIFEIYVQNTRQILNDSGVMKALDESSGGSVHYYVTDSGHMRSEVKGVKKPVIDSENSLNSSQKIEGMAKELVQSVSIKQTKPSISKVEK